MSELEFGDTPALEILRLLPRETAVDPSDLKTAQDLLRLAKRLLTGFAEQFAMHGLSPGRYALLMALKASPTPIAPSELADRLGVTRATVTGLIAGLARDGLVAYAEADANDRRRKAIALTDVGSGLLETVAPDIFRQMTALLSPLEASEKGALAAIIHKIEGGLTA